VPGLAALLTDRLEVAFAAVAGEPADPVVRRSQRADFQANGALPLAKRLGQEPRMVAERVLANASLDDVCSGAAIAGAGFINLTISDALLGEQATETAHDDRLGIGVAENPEVVVVDYSAPNVAKEMHVGHLRSTIIGDAAVRLLEWVGHTVIRQNHIGEWGTPFGMLIEHLLDIGESEAAHELSVGDLDGFYKAARRKFDAGESFRERSRRRVVLLQTGDDRTLKQWRLLVEQSERYFLAVYERLRVKLQADDFAGESIYNDQLADVVKELDRLGLLKDSDGALCAFPEGFKNRDGEPLPLIVVKSDGGYGYDTTDLAALRYRIRQLRATRLLYVVGVPQRLHLEMVFKVGEEAGWVAPPVRTEHIGFGSVTGSDGKPLRSRSGESVKLIHLLDDAVRQATVEVSERNPELDDEAVDRIVQAIGIGAVKYADLSTDRTKDYVFDLDRMLSFDGNTAPYLQYAHTRIQSIFRRAGTTQQECLGPIIVAEPTERALAIQLLLFADVLAEVEQSLEFHRLCGYLYDLATAFTSFYESCPVLKAEPDVRASRLGLCSLTARTLARGLELLGIEAPDRM
jgi:arginyl-tRNA synthetase